MTTTKTQGIGQGIGARSAARGRAGLALLLGAIGAVGIAAAGCSDDPSDPSGTTSQALSTSVVISQVFGAGGSPGAPYNQDFVELHNVGAAPVLMSGWSLQYGSSAGVVGPTGASQIYAMPTVTLAAGQYYLVGLAKGTIGDDIAPDTALVGGGVPVNLSGSNGKIALANTAQALNCNAPGAGATSCLTHPNVVDFVGYGTASEAEGTAAPATSATTALRRLRNGCAETDVNLADFEVVAPSPRGALSPPVICAVDAGAVDAGSDVVPVDATRDVAADTQPGDAGTPVDASPDVQPADTGSMDAASDAASPDAGPVDAAPADGGTVRGLVISQVYGGGGNNGSPLARDFVELLNRSNAPISLSGLALMYGGGSNDFGQIRDGSASDTHALPNALVQPGKYFLVALGAGTSPDAGPLPAADSDGSLTLSQSSGKVALVQGTAPLGCGGAARCGANPRVIDLVGYGTTASDYEGSGRAPQLSATLAAFRKGAGCTDTDDNAADLIAEAPRPRSSATAAVDCANPPDGGTPVNDGGSSDAGVPDTGTRPDAGRTDAGTPPRDAGQPADAGRVDSGTTSRPDSGATAPGLVGEDLGCSCSVAGGEQRHERTALSLAGLASLALAFVARRRRRA